MKMETSKCRQCKRKLKEDVFFYNGKTHTTCFSCSKTRVNRKNVCLTCGIRASFNRSGETFGKFCKKHSEPGMVDVKSKKCITCKIKQPVFNNPNKTKALYCAKCALPGMVDIKNKKCITCKIKRPVFNNPNETKALYCAKCALPGMVDIKSKKCITCNKRASYGIPCNLPSRCVQHKTENMISSPRARCLKKICNQTATHGSRKPTHCEEHSDDNDICLVERKCSKCGRIDVLIHDICVNFCSMEEKAKEIKKRQKLKEKRVLKILSSEYRVPDNYNKRVDYSCGKKHSEEKEIGYDYGTHRIYIEVDENQHKSYCELGEFNRMKNIYMNDGGVPVLFIRYNPDKFIIDGKRFDLPQAKREEQLIKWIKYYENFDNIKYNLSVHYLYYNENINKENKNYKIDPYKIIDYQCEICEKIFYVKDMFDEHTQEHMSGK